MATLQPVPFASTPKLELKNILVMTDFSDCSRNALKQAAAIARLHGSHLLLLHIVPAEPLIQNSLGPPTWEYGDIVRQATKQMKAVENEEILAGIDHEIVIATGSLQPILTSLVKDREISMVVAGTRGRTGIKSCCSARWRKKFSGLRLVR